jgi:hypothetical protein
LQRFGQPCGAVCIRAHDAATPAFATIKGGALEDTVLRGHRAISMNVWERYNWCIWRVNSLQTGRYVE